MEDFAKYSPQYQLLELRTISSTVAEYLARELYKDDLGPYDYTIEGILNECYSILFEELQLTGIVFTMDFSEIISDRYTANNLIKLKRLLTVDTLNQVIQGYKSDQTLDELDTLVNNAEDEQAVLLSVVDYLYEITKDVEWNELSNFIVIACKNNKVFIDTMNILLAGCGSAKVPMEALDRMAAYVQKVEAHRQQVKANVDHILDNDYSIAERVDRNKLAELIENYDYDKITAENLPMYSLIDQEDVPEYLQDLKDTYMSAHHKKTKHHIEYWSVHDDEEPTVEDIIMLVAHMFEEPSISLDYWSELSIASFVLNEDNYYLLKDMVRMLVRSLSISEKV